MVELSIRYATALMELSRESGAADEYLEQAVFLRDMLKNDECKTLLEHPRITKEEKLSFLQTAFSDSLNGIFMGFLALAIRKNRESFIVPALDAFIEMGNRYRGKTTADVVSAAPLDEWQILAIKELLSKKLGKQVDVLPRVNKSLIGGLYVHVDGYMIDRTVRKQLNDMKDSAKRRDGGYGSQA